MLRRLRQALCWHRVHLYQADGKPSISRATDGTIQACCEKCGKLLSAPYGLALPGFQLGTASS